MLPEHVLDGRVTHRRRGIQALVDFLRGGHAANIALRAEPDIFQIINNVEATGRDHTGSHTVVEGRSIHGLGKRIKGRTKAVRSGEITGCLDALSVLIQVRCEAPTVGARDAGFLRNDKSIA